MTVSAHTPPADAGMSERMLDFLAYLEFERGLSRNTLEAYRSDLLQLGAFLGRRRVDVVAAEHADLSAFLAQLAAGSDGRPPVAPATLQRKAACLRSFYRHLRREGILDRDPTADLRAPRKSQRLPQVLTRDEVARLLAAPRGTDPAALRDRALLELMYACGLRASEAIGIEVADLQGIEAAPLEELPELEQIGAIRLERVAREPALELEVGEEVEDELAVVGARSGLDGHATGFAPAHSAPGRCKAAFRAALSLDARPRAEAARARRRDPHDPALGAVLDPAARPQARRDRRAQGAGEVMTPLGPVQTCPRQGPAQALQRRDVDPELAQRRDPVAGHGKASVRDLEGAPVDQAPR